MSALESAAAGDDVEAPRPHYPKSGRTLGEQVAERLLGEIVSGVFPAEHPLPTEHELALRERVSRLTLREATGILRQKGVIEIRRGRGTYIRPQEAWSPLDPLVLGARAGKGEDDLAAIEILLEARRVVETDVAELAAQRRTHLDLEAMSDGLRQMRAAGDDVDRFVEGDLGFHDALLLASGNPVIGALFAPLRELIHAHRWSTSRQRSDRAHAIVSHQAILDAVAAGDADAARTAMAEHLRSTEAGMRRARAGATGTSSLGSGDA